MIAVASGKGGVGKSTVAVNLAVALARAGAVTGLLDADVYGPSIPLMMGTDEPPRLTAGERRLLPFERFDVRFMSLGFLVEKDSAVIWRGPMVMKALRSSWGTWPGARWTSWSWTSRPAPGTRSSPCRRRSGWRGP